MPEDKLQLLVVEDDEDDFLLVRDLLHTAVDAHVERAATADQALERTATHAYDAMLLDYRLGAHNGLDLLRSLRQRDVAAPVIFLTGHGDEQVAVQAMKAGATDYLTKSHLSEPDLARAVHYAIHLRRQEAAIQAAQRALHASEQRFRALVENSSDIVALLAADASILFVSQSVQRILGYTPEELLELDALSLVHPDDLPAIRLLLAEVLRSPGLPLRNEHRSRHKDGRHLVMEVTVTNRLHENAVHAIVLNSRDITPRREAEKALRQSEADYRTLFESANDALLILEPDQELILEANPQACRQYGFSRDQLLGRSLRQLTHDVERGREAIAQCLQAGSLRDFETVHFRGDGSRLDVLANASTITYRGVTAILIVARDVTEQRAAQREIYRLNRALQALSKGNQAVLQATGQQSLLQQICDIAVEVGRYRLAWVGVLPDDGGTRLTPAAASGDAQYVALMSGKSPTDLAALPPVVALRTQEPEVCRDPSSDERYAPLRQEWAARGYASMISLPLNLPSGRCGVLSIYSADRNAFEAAEVALLTELAANLSYGLNALHTAEARERAEQQLRDSESRLRRLIETANEGIWTLDEQERTTFVNPKMADMLDYAPEQMLGRPLSQFLPAQPPAPPQPAVGHGSPPREPEPGSETRATHLAAHAAPWRGRNEVRLRRRDGRCLWVQLDSSALLDGSGQYCGLLAMVTDITEQIQAADALRASESRYRSLVTATSQIVWTTDASGQPLGDCSKWAEFTGQSLDQMRDFGWLDAVHPDDRDALAHMFRDSVARNQGYQIEYRLRRHDGQYRYIAERGVPILDPQGALREWVGTGADITDSRNLQQQLLHSQKLDAIGQLAGGVAHDFNNLLMVIGSHAELLRDRTPDAAAARKAGEILEGVHRGASLTRQLLAFSRKQVLSPRVLDLNHNLAELGATLPRVLGETVAVDLRPAPQLWSVRADPAQIEQVIVNLALNARDAMPHGGRLTLETANVHLDAGYGRLHAVPPGPYVLLAVSDTGHGIPPDVLPHIFEPFFTTKERGQGTGLGLPTVYGIVQQSGGFVWVYSELDRGTVFKIYLPRVDAPAPLAAASPIATPALAGHETVLLVEDEAAVRAAAREYLSLKGYQLLEAADGEQALALAQSFPHPIDVVVTDLVMPGLNGSEMARRLLALRPGLRVLFISGYTEATLGQQGVPPGAAFLQKPFSLSVLAAKIREVLAAPE